MGGLGNEPVEIYCVQKERVGSGEERYLEILLVLRVLHKPWRPKFRPGFPFYVERRVWHSRIVRYSTSTSYYLYATLTPNTKFRPTCQQPQHLLRSHRQRRASIHLAHPSSSFNVWSWDTKISVQFKIKFVFNAEKGMIRKQNYPNAQNVKSQPIVAGNVRFWTGSRESAISIPVRVSWEWLCYETWL